ncbi:hypothetical protein Hanom_Chr11g01059311 [Helianthus anomalus]
MQQREKSYYISVIACATNGSSLVVGTKYIQQCYKVSESLSF